MTSGHQHLAFQFIGIRHRLLKCSFADDVSCLISIGASRSAATRASLTLSTSLFSPLSRQKERKRVHLFSHHPGKHLFLMIRSQPLSSFNMSIYFLLCIIVLPEFVHGYMTMLINFEYYTPVSNYVVRKEDSRTNGIVSTKGSQSIVPFTYAFVFNDTNGNYDACQPSVPMKNYPNGIAIIQRGGNCTFSVKVTRAKQCGAAGRSRALDTLPFSLSPCVPCFSRCHLRSTESRPGYVQHDTEHVRYHGRLRSTVRGLVTVRSRSE